jgi:GLPGLI family protein
MSISFKNIWVALALFFIVSGASAQETPPLPEGKIRYIVTQNYSKQMASLEYISKQRKERNAYMWGGSRSEWKMYTNLYFTPTESKYEDAQESVEDDDMGYSWRKGAHTLRRNFATNTLRDHIEMMGKTYVIEDTIRAQDWKIMNDLKEVAGHICMNAFWIDTLRDQEITVWFALDIPVSAGPERLCGLPGLILEVDINDGALNLVADKLDLQKLTTEMDVPKKLKGKKVTEAEYLDVIAKHVAEKKKNEEPWFWGLRYF